MALKLPKRKNKKEGRKERKKERKKEGKEPRTNNTRRYDRLSKYNLAWKVRVEKGKVEETKRGEEEQEMRWDVRILWHTSTIRYIEALGKKRWPLIGEEGYGRSVEE